MLSKTGHGWSRNVWVETSTRVNGVVSCDVVPSTHVMISQVVPVVKMVKPGREEQT